MSKARLVIADDHSIVLQAYRQLLEPEYTVVGTASNGQELLAVAPQLAPDIILLDISMPIMGGFPAARHLHNNYPEVSFIFVSQHRDHFYLDAVLECGAKGFIVKSAAATELPVALVAFEAGEVYRSNLIK